MLVVHFIPKPWLGRGCKELGETGWRNNDATAPPGYLVVIEGLLDGNKLVDMHAATEKSKYPVASDANVTVHAPSPPVSVGASNLQINSAADCVATVVYKVGLRIHKNRVRPTDRINQIDSPIRHLGQAP